MAKQQGTNEGGTMRSPEGSASPHPWTPEEMSRATPLPIPETEAAAEPTPIRSAAGAGQVSKGGAPE